jgi:glycosyltransferase involved in cell wall biosynthesis
MRDKQDLVSVIMPAYNASMYIEEAIQSVINQTYQDWELIIVNDGSSDDTEEKILQFSEPKIRYYKQPNGGVAVARNVGLKKMKGSYFCFLDADDSYTEKSLSSRIEVFQSEDEIVFVDGAIKVYDKNTGETIRVFKPKFKGVCTDKLLSLSEDCFFGPSWMVKIENKMEYEFIEGQTHSEDLTFYLKIAGSGNYSYAEEVILNYRLGNSSAMDNLEGLEKGYLVFLKEANRLYGKYKWRLFELRLRIVKIMFLSYLSKKKYIPAVKILRRLIN